MPRIDRFLTRHAALGPAPLGLGGAALGHMFRAVAEEEACAIIEDAWAAGIRVFDTAALYGGGLSEERFGKVLERRDRDAYFLSTKVGRFRDYAAPPPHQGGPADRWHFDGDNVLRSIEQSLTRLRTDHLDLVHLHDCDHHLDAALNDAYPTLLRLKEEGVIGAIGAGLTTVSPLLELAQRADFDAFLVAGRYTLLDQSAASDLFPLCHAKGIRIVLGGVFNSGILATGDVPKAHFDYAAAGETVRERVRRLEDLCRRHGVSLAQAALQFARAHEDVALVLLGASKRPELEQSLADAERPVPPALWQAMAEDGLIPADPKAWPTASHSPKGAADDGH